MARDYYEVLEVERTCSEVELKGAFRKAAMKHHPDRNPGDAQAEVRFKECNEAYSILSDPQKRAAYDRFGHAAFQNGGGGGGQPGGFQGDPGDIFGEAFGEMFGGGQRRSGPARGQDLRYDLEITLEQAFLGAEVEIVVPSTMTCETCEGSGAKPGTQPTTCQTCGGQGRVRAAQGFFSVERTCPRCGGRGKIIADPCRTCHGAGQVRRDRTLQVRIPAGVDDGARIRLTGEGDAGQRGGPRGDLYIFLSVAPHDLFERDGMDLHVRAPVTMATAALGGEIDVPCMAAGANPAAGDCKVKVKIPEGSQTGRTIRLRDKGMSALRTRARGDLVVELFVETPTKLTSRQKELMRELAETASGDHHHPEQAGFFKKARKFWDGLTGAEVDTRV